MYSQRTKRFFWILLILLISALAFSLILFALKQNINLFFTPTQISQNEAPENVRIRIGGMVEKGSLQRKNELEISFKITDFQHQITVQYQGILPDLFREGQGIVALGKLERSNLFVADEILAKHDENYMPPEIKQTLKDVK